MTLFIGFEILLNGVSLQSKNKTTCIQQRLYYR